jgi:hypothetical protein
MPILIALSLLIPTVYANSGCDTSLGPCAPGLTQLQQLFLRLIGIAISLAFFLLTVMFVYAGIKFIISNGDPKNLTAARQTIIQAITGLVFMGLAWIVLLLIDAFAFGGKPVLTQFCLGLPGVVGLSCAN